MAREDSVKRKEHYFPKKRLTAATAGLLFTVLSVVVEKVFKSILDTALSVVAGASILVFFFTLFAFFGAWEKRENLHDKEMDAVKIQMEEIHNKQVFQCNSCNFSYQSLLVGLSANHVNELQEQRDYYEDYIAAVLYVLDTTLVRTARAESSILPIVEGLMQSPLYKEYKENKELIKWRTFLNSIRADLTKQG